MNYNVFYREGYEAYQNHKPLTSNPYITDDTTEREFAWEDGWFFGFDEYMNAWQAGDKCVQ